MTRRRDEQTLRRRVRPAEIRAVRPGARLIDGNDGAAHLFITRSETGKQQGSGPALGGLRWRLAKLTHRALLALADLAWSAPIRWWMDRRRHTGRRGA